MLGTDKSSTNQDTPITLEGLFSGTANYPRGFTESGGLRSL